jgi:hypothetical protein
MARALRAALMAVTAAGGLTLAAQPARAATLCVGSSPGCYRTIQAAVNAAHDGDTITIGPGTFAGGVTITTSIHLQGAGSAVTIIRGGGSVLTIGAYGASRDPAVSISGVTITGGVARSSPESAQSAFFGVAGQWAAGGGIEIPPDASLTGGATVTISDSVITGNHVDPSTPIPSGIPCPGFVDGQCPFAVALGGGIDSWGTLTLVNTTVSGNSVGMAPGLPPLASDADGAGIYSDQGSLTLIRTTVLGNHAVAAIPNGRFAEGAGINIGNWFGVPGGDALTVQNSVITGNTASLTSDLPSFFGGQLINLQSNAGGIHIDSGIPTTIENSQVTANFATANDLNGEAESIDAAMIVQDSPLVIGDSVISGNQSISRAATTADVGPAGTGIEVDGGGTISNSSITANISKIVTPNGAAAVVGGALGVFNFTNDPRLLTVRNSIISGNTLLAASTTGSAAVQGAGIFNNSLLELIGDTVSNNSGTAVGPSGTAQGGGIWNGVDLSGPPVQLTLVGTAITRNVLTGSQGITVQGGGLFTTLPVTLTGSLIADNIPDQCVGCTSNAASSAGQRAHANNQTGSRPSPRDHHIARPG